MVHLNHLQIHHHLRAYRSEKRVWQERNVPRTTWIEGSVT